MSSSTYFDESLPAFAGLVLSEWGKSALAENFFLRDVTGRLTFIVTDSYPPEKRLALANLAATMLRPYVDEEGFAVATPDELFDDRLRDRQGLRLLHLDSILFVGDVFLVDRRMVGADWLRDIKPPSVAPVRLVFASLKGGVGRSTALCVLAAHLSSKGRRVLAIDMDLEAPGLGNMLLPEDTLPEFGLLDYLVEHNLRELDDEFYADMVGPSWLGGGRGRVDVVPAIGKRSLSHPSNVLAKLARAYLGGPEPSSSIPGELSSFADHMHALLARLGDPTRYDIILIDARAGLHETTAAAFTSLGAQVFLFGIDQPQTFAGFDLLFAHLATVSTDANSGWPLSLKIVHAKASDGKDARDRFNAAITELYNKYFQPRNPLTDVKTDLLALKDTFDVEWVDDTSIDAILDDDNSEGVERCIAIMDDLRFQSFDPISDRDSLAERVYSAIFGEFLDDATELINAAPEPKTV